MGARGTPSKIKGMPYQLCTMDRECLVVGQQLPDVAFFTTHIVPTWYKTCRMGSSSIGVLEADPLCFLMRSVVGHARSRGKGSNVVGITGYWTVEHMRTEQN